MPKAYWVVTYRSITNSDAWKAYAKLARPAIEWVGGRFLALNNPAKTYEAGLDQRVVLIEFDSPTRCSPATIRLPTRKRSRYSAPVMSSATCASSRESSASRSPRGKRKALVRSGGLLLGFGKNFDCNIEIGRSPAQGRQAAARSVRGLAV